MRIKITHFDYADSEKPMHIFFVGEVEGKSYPITYVPALDLVLGDYPKLPLRPFTLEIACADSIFSQEQIEEEIKHLIERMQIYAK